MESKVCKTYDGSVVEKGDYAWKCSVTGKTHDKKRDKPVKTLIPRDFYAERNCVYFSSELLCIEYIDKFNEPLFRTEDNVMVKHSQKVWACHRDGRNMYYHLDTPYESYAYKAFYADRNYIFSTKQACQAYIDSMNGVKPTPTPEPKSLMGQEWDKSMADALEITNEKWAQMLGRPYRIGTPLPRIEFSPKPTEPPTPFSASAKAIKEYDEWKEEMHRHLVLSQFSQAYKIPINTVLEFIVNQKTK